MKNSTITRVVLLGAVAIICIIGLQTYWVLNTWNLKEQEFHEKVVLALRNVGKSFEKIKTMPQYDLVERVSSNYYVVNINQVINANSLEYFLKREMQAVGIDESFRYAIYDCATSQMVGGNFIQAGKVVEPPSGEANELPTYDKYLYYFGVSFPNRMNHVLVTMIPTIVMTAIMLLTVLFFSFSILVILRQKRLSEMQKDFINNMTHEFKTPISTIKISADVFLKDASIQADPRLHRYANIIKQQNERLNGQVEKVLQLARIERDNFQLNIESINVYDVLEECLRGVRMKVEQLGGTLNTELLASSSTILADRLHFTNILHNLLDNAIKYCKDEPELHIGLKEKGNILILQISDKGIGIAKEYQDKVFQKFYRVPTGNVHNVKGFGLGLFYIKNICRAHAWKLTLDSEKDKGTTIEIQIPKAAST